MSNVLHQKGDFISSSRTLFAANNTKLSLYPSNGYRYIKDSNKLSIICKEYTSKEKDISHSANCIFIVGMPRSGSTLIESILSINPKTIDLEETNILEKAFLEWQSNKSKSLYEMYLERRPKGLENSSITTDKMLFNYIYTGLIASQFPGAKIIHCFRHPLDNILSIYRANFETGYRYSSSLSDCANVLVNKNKVMNEYKKRFPAKIYELNYDKLVKSSNQEIKSLIDWLGWDWNESYLSPHLTSRMVSTASNVQVRSPINKNSLGGWKNYQDLLSPAIEILKTANELIN